MNIKHAYLILVASSVFLCGADKIDSQNGLCRSYSISPDDQYIIFAHESNDVSSIYKASIDGANAKQLVSSDSLIYFNPEYSHDGSKILFLGYSKKNN